MWLSILCELRCVRRGASTFWVMMHVAVALVFPKKQLGRLIDSVWVLVSECACMADAAVCFDKEVLVKDASLDEVVNFCNQALKAMRLRIDKEESSQDGKTTIFASEGALVPLTLKVLLSPFNMQEFVKKAQRSGLHVVVSPDKAGVHVYSYGIALDEITGKLAEYTKDEIVEEVTNTLDELDFENKFVKRILEHFPKAKQIR